MRRCVFDEGYIQFLCHPTRCLEVVIDCAIAANDDVCLDQRIAFGLLGDALAEQVILFGGILVFEEAAACDGVEEDRDASLRACLIDEPSEVVVERGRTSPLVGAKLGFGGAGTSAAVLRLDLFVVVSELDEDVVAGLDGIIDLLPFSFEDEGEGAATVQRMIIDTDVVGKESRQHLSPATFLVVAIKGLVGHGRIADHEDGDGTLGVGAGECQHQHHCSKAEQPAMGSLQMSVERE